MTKLVLKALKEFDGKRKTYWFMQQLEKHMYAFENPPFRLSLGLARCAEESFDTQRAMMQVDIHYADVLLNPYYLNNHMWHDNADAKFGLCWP